MTDKASQRPTDPGNRSLQGFGSNERAAFVRTAAVTVASLDGEGRVQDDRFLNREQGQIGFNERVLTMAEDESVPLLERLRYLTIVSNNLDEFFEVRIAELKGLLATGHGDESTIRATMVAHAERVRALIERQYRLLDERVLPALAAEGIVVLTVSEWTPTIRAWAEAVFFEEIEPLLTPIGLDPAHPFPNVLNKSLNFIIELEGKDAFGRRADVAVVQAPRVLPRVLRVPGEVSGQPHSVMLLSSIVLGFADRLFPGLTVRGVHQFRITRNSDLFVDDEAITDLRSALQDELSQRHFGDAVRLEVSASCPDSLVTRLLTEVELEMHDCFRVNGPVNLVRLAALIDLVDRPDLKFPGFAPRLPDILRGGDLFAAIRREDILVHHPYESFAPVMEFLRSAASDPRVVAIKQTIYRTGSDSQLMEALIAASRAGKAVTVVVELMARFDEENNIKWANRLEEAGVHVVYGVVGHKTHAKMALIVRREDGRLVRYAHLGTGNYHSATARLYEDFGMFTCDEAICADVHEVFRRMTGLGQAGALRALLQAPFTLADGVIAAIGREIEHARAGRKAYLAAKMNSLVEATVVDALYEASRAGVKIDLIVRGICVLRPGVRGLSETIRVRSVVGRFLEHSRVYYFLNDGARDVWLASADWMDRNLHRRVEIAFPVASAPLKRRVVEEAISVHLRDNDSAWQMQSDGSYLRRRHRGGNAYVSQRVLLNGAQA
ncbi:MAG: polyphosphate kinase 1 [Burkholderiaceae bacterium]